MAEKRSGFLLRGELRLKNARLVKTREGLGMDQKQFAKYAGVSRYYYHAIENLHAYPGREMAQRLASVCDCDVEELFPIELTEYAKDKSKSLLVMIAEVEPSRLLGFTQREVLALPDPGSAESVLEEVLLGEDIGIALSFIKPREARILRLYFGLEGEEEHTLEEIGVIENITRERVRQIKEKALSRLRHFSRRKSLEDHHEFAPVRHPPPPIEIPLSPEAEAGIAEYRERMSGRIQENIQ